MLQPRCIYAISIRERQITLQNNKLKKKQIEKKTCKFLIKTSKILGKHAQLIIYTAVFYVQIILVAGRPSS